MATILILAHVEADGSLGKPSLEALTAAKQLGGSLVVGLIGADVQSAANQVAGAGAAKILGVSGPDFSQARYATDVAAAAAIAQAAQATVILVPHTSRWGRVAAAVAHRLGGRVDTHVTGLAADGDQLTVTRWYYRQRMEAVLSRTHRPWLIALDPGCQAPWQGDAGQATVTPVPVTTTAAQQRTSVTGVVAPQTGKQTIRPDAALLFVAGAG
ncbi:electron transfer flavoprotein subunit alpha, partial [bacterium]|nr:electron transfer flavoprotein subunit alpha [bacterium]